MNEKNNDYSVVSEILYSINYIYYGVYFLLFAALQVSHVILVSHVQVDLWTGYAFCAIVESFIEVAIMAAISSLLLHYKRKGIHRLFLFFTLILLCTRIIDLLLVRLMDISVWYGIDLFLQESWGNFIEILRASNVQFSVWFLGLGAIIAFFFLGSLIFSYSQKICSKKPLGCSVKSMTGSVILCFSLLAITDVFFQFEISPASVIAYNKALPWKRTLVSSEGNFFTTQGYLKRLPDNPFDQKADSALFALEKKPDLFLFIVESLRDDFLTEEVTPSLAQFKRENTFFPEALSCANATHLSWFSTFYSLYPFYWGQFSDPAKDKGSHSLALLKKMGYDIHVYAASRLGFYSMDRILFGANGSLVTSLQQFQGEVPIPPHQADSEAIEALCRDVSSGQKGGRVFVVFLDSTHFDYSWPDQKSGAFGPIDDKINYLKVACMREDLSGIKNRYKNSLRHVDDLFDCFQKTLKECNLWEDSFVVFTGDHGEEFNECGHMFHASTLSSPQLQIPLYIKLAGESKNWELNTQGKASQMDIFPTFFHYVLGQDMASSFLQGTSLFSDEPRTHVIGARYNASRPPSEFYIQSGDYRMILEFENNRDIFYSKNLKVHTIEDENKEQVPFTPLFVQTYFGHALDELFSREE